MQKDSAMSDLPNKMDLKSMNITEEQKANLKQIFPEVFNEDKIDFDKLKRTLGEEFDTGEERFGMTWPGKNDCFRVIQEPSIATLKPCKQESVDWDNTENLFIEGDNLEVLKLLQRSYYGKVKMIYIDPPYNTGNQFIYPDKYSESLETYLAYTGQIDVEGVKFSTNTEAEGRFHSKWMNMMYPRLFLAKNLLKENGIIFISIDDNEASNLKKLCDEIFGEENFIDTICWKKKYGGGAKEKYLVSVHEYILLYAKNKIDLPEILVEFDPKKARRFYKYKDEKFETLGYYRTHPLEAVKSFDIRDNLRFPVIAPDGTEVYPKRQWRWSKERFEEALSKDEVIFSKNKDGEWVLSSKQYLNDESGERRKTKAQSLIDDIFTQEGTKEIVDIFGDAKIFPFPKPNRLTKKLLEIGGLSKNDIILDFFSGSCTTAQATLELNKEDGINRNFIMVQLPEPCEKNSEAYEAGYKTISAIGKERIHHVIKKIKEVQTSELKDAEGTLPGLEEERVDLDLGFRVFKLEKSNFNIWDGTVSEEGDVEGQLELAINHINTDSSDEDILYEILLKSGFELTTKIKELNLVGKKVYSIADNALLICLERNLIKEVITEMARLQPARVVCLDIGFADNDQLKTNAVQIMKSHNIEDFRTV
jgi:adenine-specific DNA-methyltransferase